MLCGAIPQHPQISGGTEHESKRTKALLCELSHQRCAFVSGAGWQAADSGRALKPVPTGFDYQAAREEADRMESNLQQYEQCNQLINDSIVAIQSGERMPIEITHFDNRGRRVHTTLTDIPPEIVRACVHRRFKSVAA